MSQPIRDGRARSSRSRADLQHALAGHRREHLAQARARDERVRRLDPETLVVRAGRRVAPPPQRGAEYGGGAARQHVRALTAGSPRVEHSPLHQAMNSDSLLLWMPYRPTERTEARKAATRERIVAAALDQVARGRLRLGRRAAPSPSAPGSPPGRSTATSRPRPSCSRRSSGARRSRELDVVARLAGDRRPSRRRARGGARRGVLPARAGRPGARVRADRRAGRSGARGRAPHAAARLPRRVRRPAREGDRRRRAAPSRTSKRSPPAWSAPSARRSSGPCPRPRPAASAATRRWSPSLVQFCLAAIHRRRSPAMAVTPRAADSTHEVLNQPPPLVDYNAFDADPALREALEREGGAWGVDRVRDFGAVVGSAGGARARPARAAQPARSCTRTTATATASTRSTTTRRCTGCCASASSARSTRCRGATRGPGAHVVRAGLFYLLNQLDTGPCCPMSINYAAMPTMRQDAGAGRRVGAAPDAARLRPLRAGGHGDDREAGRLGSARQHHASPSRSATAGTSSPATSGSARTRSSTSSSRSPRPRPASPASWPSARIPASASSA